MSEDPDKLKIEPQDYDIENFKIFYIIFKCKFFELGFRSTINRAKNDVKKEKKIYFKVDGFVKTNF